MSSYLRRKLALMVFLLVAVSFSSEADAQNYYGVAFGAYGPVPPPVSVVTHYRGPIAAPYVAAPYVAARVPVPFVPPVPVAAYPYAVARPAVVAPVAYYAPRPVVARTKYYVPFQPVRNTVRALTP